MSGIVERLRTTFYLAGLHDEAADTIEAQAERVRVLREALEIIAAQASGKVGSSIRSDCMAAIAEQALRATK